ncbi:MAG: protein kinase, partial [Myxococcota bacterium]|nr:protein kinase [Myxococcota bacterium]
MNESTEASLVGRTIAGKFLIESLIGVGAMGAVYKARQIALEKAIAIKVLHPERARDPMHISLFQREARAASRLDHPNSVRVLDFGHEPDGLLYIAMEYFAGRDLFALMAEDWPMSGRRIADILSQALAAIAVAHDMGIVHRDLKPENILVQRGNDDEGASHDVVKVCDFGIAKFTEQSDSSRSRAMPRLTEGIIIGTPHYMSPEQGQGGTLDTRSDIYSIGVILYQMLTSRVPFEGTTPIDVVIQHVRDDPVPPTKLVPYVDPRLESICLKALKKKKEDRYQSAREMRMDLRALVAVQSPTAEPLRPRVSKEASTLPPPNSEGSAAVQERSASKMTLPPTASAARPKARRPGMSMVVVASAVAIAGATLLMMHLSRSNAVANRPPPSAGAVVGSHPQPTTTLSEKDRRPLEGPALEPEPTRVPMPAMHEPPKLLPMLGPQRMTKAFAPAAEPTASVSVDNAAPPPMLPAPTPPAVASSTSPPAAPANATAPPAQNSIA